MKTKKSGSTTITMFLVIRYHGAPVVFSTLVQAEEFAWNCGDFDKIEILEGSHPSSQLSHFSFDKAPR